MVTTQIVTTSGQTDPQPSQNEGHVIWLTASAFFISSSLIAIASSQMSYRTVNTSLHRIHLHQVRGSILIPSALVYPAGYQSWNCSVLRRDLLGYDNMRPRFAQFAQVTRQAPNSLAPKSPEYHHDGFK